MGVVAGPFGQASGNKSKSATESGGEDDERTDCKRDPRVTSREAS
jgi:hypothetical protein